MLEIIILLGFAKKIGERALDSGRSKGWWILFTVLFWFGGEFLGAVIGFAITNGSLAGYLFALAGAGLGALIVNGISKSWTASPSSAIAYAAAGATRTCSGCGTIVEKNAAACPRCGWRI